MTEQMRKPIVFRCPTTGIDVISPVRDDGVWPKWASGHPIALACFCGLSHVVQMRHFRSDKRIVRQAVDVLAR